MNDEAVLLLALLRTPGIGLITADRLCRAAGSATRLWEERANISRLLQASYLPAICFSCCSIIFLTIYPPTDPFCLEVRSPL